MFYAFPKGGEGTFQAVAHLLTQKAVLFFSFKMLGFVLWFFFNYKN